ncbi:Dam family site-specific DNA-(adenine-N6)-methyltransferase [Mycobacterium sp. SMC-4]|uniref:DNA adenine methylase n=1 Tax=Mycobacterium sp. SMC-4 TaxID=2857059 RepID=UPI0021B41A58|nr:Dam family site-specific DNA-(adenine-N6)-methyltransferase [Mycobacterium sp. SMC-4]
MGGLDYRNYHEPFLGAGSIFFALNPQRHAYLSDLNSELISTYEAVARNPSGIATRLLSHPNTAEHYYQVRGTRTRGYLSQAAAFIYLNHTSFNGLYRVNLNGRYNVPYGHRKHLRIPDTAHLLNVSRRLRNVTLSTQDFEKCIAKVRERDLVFLDPPYTVAHNNNGFVKYNQRLFAFEDQVRLLRTIKEIDNRGAYYVLTNAAHESILELFGHMGRYIHVARKSAISASASARGQAQEFLFTNIAEG